MKFEYKYRDNAINNRTKEMDEKIERMMLEHNYIKVNDNCYVSKPNDPNAEPWLRALFLILIFHCPIFYMKVEKFDMYFDEENKEREDCMKDAYEAGLEFVKKHRPEKYQAWLDKIRANM